MKAVVFYRKSGRPDSRMLENDKDFDETAKRITREAGNEGADIIGVMDYAEANEWVRQRLANEGGRTI